MECMEGSDGSDRLHLRSRPPIATIFHPRLGLDEEMKRWRDKEPLSIWNPNIFHFFGGLGVDVLQKNTPLSMKPQFFLFCQGDRCFTIKKTFLGAQNHPWQTGFYTPTKSFGATSGCCRTCVENNKQLKEGFFSPKKIQPESKKSPKNVL